MNKIPFLILLGGVALASCNTTPAIGDWQDNIKLSTKVVSFNSGKDSVTIKTGGDFWWLTCISLDGTPTHRFWKNERANLSLFRQARLLLLYKGR